MKSRIKKGRAYWGDSKHHAEIDFVAEVNLFASRSV
jgi:hypothetical protein